jgi:hypothetical protein
MRASVNLAAVYPPNPERSSGQSGAGAYAGFDTAKNRKHRKFAAQNRIIPRIDILTNESARNTRNARKTAEIQISSAKIIHK